MSQAVDAANQSELEKTENSTNADPQNITWLTGSLLGSAREGLELWISDNFSDIDEFQWNILKTLLTFLCINLTLICLAWKKYGGKITERFMKPDSSKALDDLRKEATELKLPKEHCPRI